jgi:hypothetical protein
VVVAADNQDLEEFRNQGIHPVDFYNMDLVREDPTCFTMFRWVSCFFGSGLHKLRTKGGKHKSKHHHSHSLSITFVEEHKEPWVEEGERFIVSFDFVFL